MILDNSPIEHDKYVNHDLSVQLDSSNAFEGPEKLLEIWFAPSAAALPSDNKNGLRAVERETWESMLDIVKCKVLSTVSTSCIDSFLLSESSMFVFPHKLILKTCGTTTTLIGIPRILEIAASVGFSLQSGPYRVFYSRKSLMFPEMQCHPHRSWDDEVAFLENFFDNGSSYMVGNLAGDHWHLYTTEPNLKLACANGPQEDCDQTLEILMTDLDPKAASKFYTKRHAGDAKLHYDSDICGISDLEYSSGSDSEDDSKLSTDPGHELGALVTKHAAIDQIYPCAQTSLNGIPNGISNGPLQTIDSFGFTPCGYSCNSLIGEDNYFTIHVTPESGFSYASFETNVPAAKAKTSIEKVLANVVNVFRPGKFSLTLFEAHRSEYNVSISSDFSNSANFLKSQKRDIDTLATRIKATKELDGYKRTDRILYELDGYDLVFMSFEAIY